MEFLTRAPTAQASIALFPGAWNPPTRAHLAMAAAALEYAECVVFVLARAMPHKTIEGASFDTRVKWLEAIASLDPRYYAAISDGGLFIDMARECRAATDAGAISIVCGRDAAERVVSWDYGAGGSIEAQLAAYRLLVAPRAGPYQPPPHLASSIHPLHLPGDWHDVSSTEVRRRMDAGEEWRSLVPDGIAG